MSAVSSVPPPTDIQTPPPAPPPPPTVNEFSFAKSRSRNIRAASAPSPPPGMEGCDIGVIKKYKLPGRERVAPKIFDPSFPQPTKRRRGRPSNKRLTNVSCMYPEAAGSDSQTQVENAATPVPASPMTPPANQSHDNQTIHPVRDHLGIQAPASIAVSSIHRPIGPATNLKVENRTLNEDEYRREDVISAADMEPHQGVNLNFSNGVAETLTVQNQPTTNTRVSNMYNLGTCYTNILFPTVDIQPITTTGDSGIYNVNPSYADTLKSIFKKHGDIAKDCTLQSPYLKTSFLEVICMDVQELQSKKLSELDYGQLNSYYLVVNDGEAMKFNVKWFRDRLDEIRSALDSLVEWKKIDEKMKQLKDRKRDLHLKKVELEKLISDVEAKESELALETLLRDEDKNRSSRDLDKFKNFQDMHVMDGVLL